MRQIDGAIQYGNTAARITQGLRLQLLARAAGYSTFRIVEYKHRTWWTVGRGQYAMRGGRMGWTGVERYGGETPYNVSIHPPPGLSILTIHLCSTKLSHATEIPAKDACGAPRTDPPTDYRGGARDHRAGGTDPHHHQRAEAQNVKGEPASPGLDHRGPFRGLER